MIAPVIETVKANAGKTLTAGAGIGTTAFVIWLYTTFALVGDLRDTRVQLQTLRETVGQLEWALEHEGRVRSIGRYSDTTNPLTHNP